MLSKQASCHCISNYASTHKASKDAGSDTTILNSIPNAGPQKHL